MSGTDATDRERAEAVRRFDAVYGEMDRVLWSLSRACRPSLLRGEHSMVLDEFVWTLKSWWGVQGVRLETKPAMGAALAELAWAPEHFEEAVLPVGRAEIFACEMVGGLVSRSIELGAQRREFSLASKVLHWLMPWRVPVFDTLVRAAFRVPDAWDLPEAYQRVVDMAFTRVRDMAGADTSWMGTSEPQSPLHALDKWLWWQGGGWQGSAVVVSDPAKVLRRLGLAT